MARIVCLDFNGVLDQYAGWHGDSFMYPPRQGVAHFLATLKDRGYTVVIQTAINVGSVKNWLNENGLTKYVDDVTNVKPPAYVYVDDRAIKFEGDYDATLRQIEMFRTYWEPE